MKRLFGIALLLGICVGFSYGQSQQIARAYGTATTSFQKFGFSERVYNWTFKNDASSGTDTLWVVIGSDTSSTNRFPVKQGETIPFSGVRNDTIAVKASANTIPFRAWGIH